MVVLHAGLALTFKILFFNYYVIKEIGPGADIPGIPADGGANGTVALLARIFS